ncbi:HNH endonuclease signature motif containing protein [Raineyella sp. W15-4]|uniref:HNH endonuclease signature motif containing protein n=1 Tax=Raineyella sp. W15-4 TaxID=3081651 RepID=UPI0029535808|nr:HNH endonuclease signature motif containing protein [Raineyella sp. W15-4]WOQ17477.1 HNH endonuclease signature motif containing protein [Raineyella sp. W15-4]
MNEETTPPLPGLPDGPGLFRRPPARPVADGASLLADGLMVTLADPDHPEGDGGDPVAVTAGYGLPEDPADHLDQLAEIEALARFAEIRRLALVADLVEATAPVDREQLVPLGGEGAPAVPEFLHLEVGGALGIAPDRARLVISDALDLKWRHPKLWNQMVHGRLPVWRAVQVARRCHPLSAVAAVWIDDRIGDRIPGLSWARAQRLLDGEIAAADPATADRQERARHRRRLDLYPRQGTGGACDVFGVLDAADATQLDQTLAAMAADLAAGGDESDLDNRRARALGLLARGRHPGQTPVVHLYVHTTPEADVARVEGRGPLARTALGQLLAGCRVRLTRVIDHADSVPVDAYEVPDRMREQLLAAQPVEVVPYGSLSARQADADHTIPWARGGPTAIPNLGPLGRTAHRARTHGGYQLTQPRPGQWHWQTPRGQHFLVTNQGTTRLRT